MPKHPEHLTLSQIESQLSASGKLALHVIETLAPKEQLLIQQYFDTRHPFLSALNHAPNTTTKTLEKSEPESDSGLSTTDVAKMLELSPTTIREWVNSDRFPGATKFGRDWRIPIAALTNFKRQKRGRPRKI